MNTFADEFKRSGGQPIHYEGRTLQLSYWLPVQVGDRVIIEFLKVAESPVQGLGITAKGCQLRVSTITSRNIALWTDTAPRVVEIGILKATRDAKVGLMNQWRDVKYGTTLMGLNNAAMEVISQPESVLLLHCSDGWGDPDFNDLVVKVTHERASHP